MCRFPEWGCKQEARYRRKKRLWAEIDPQETGRGVAPETGIEPTAGVSAAPAICPRMKRRRNWCAGRRRTLPCGPWRRRSGLRFRFERLWQGRSKSQLVPWHRRLPAPALEHGQRGLDIPFDRALGKIVCCFQCGQLFGHRTHNELVQCAAIGTRRTAPASTSRKFSTSASATPAAHKCSGLACTHPGRERFAIEGHFQCVRANNLDGGVCWRRPRQQCRGAPLRKLPLTGRS